MIQAIIPILFAMMCDSTRCEPLGHTTPLFEQTELSVCLENEEDSKTYLKHVALYVPPRKLPLLFPGNEHGGRQVQRIQSRVHTQLEIQDGGESRRKRKQRSSLFRKGRGDGTLRHLPSGVVRRLLVH